MRLRAPLTPSAWPRGPATYTYTGHTVFSISDDGILTLVSTTDKEPFDVCAALS